jgi:hypothetical protein
MNSTNNTATPATDNSNQEILSAAGYGALVSTLQILGYLLYSEWLLKKFARNGSETAARLRVGGCSQGDVAFCMASTSGCGHMLALFTIGGLSLLIISGPSHASTNVQKIGAGLYFSLLGTAFIIGSEINRAKIRVFRQQTVSRFDYCCQAANSQLRAFSAFRSRSSNLAVQQNQELLEERPENTTALRIV